MPQINTIVRVSDNSIALFLDESNAIREVIRRIKTEPSTPIAIHFPNFSLEYQPSIIGNGVVTGILALHAPSDARLEELHRQLEAAQDELNGNQSG